MGLEVEAQKYVSLLGYNYNTSEWYEESYKILNKDYKIVERKKKNKKVKEDGLFKRIIEIVK